MAKKKSWQQTGNAIASVANNRPQNNNNGNSGNYTDNATKQKDLQKRRQDYNNNRLNYLNQNDRESLNGGRGNDGANQGFWDPNTNSYTGRVDITDQTLQDLDNFLNSQKTGWGGYQSSQYTDKMDDEATQYALSLGDYNRGLAFLQAVRRNNTINDRFDQEDRSIRQNSGEYVGVDRPRQNKENRYQHSDIYDKLYANNDAARGNKQANTKEADQDKTGLTNATKGDYQIDASENANKGSKDNTSGDDEGGGRSKKAKRYTINIRT